MSTLNQQQVARLRHLTTSVIHNTEYLIADLRDTERYWYDLSDKEKSETEQQFKNLNFVRNLLRVERKRLAELAALSRSLRIYELDNFTTKNVQPRLLSRQAGAKKLFLRANESRIVALMDEVKVSRHVATRAILKEFDGFTIK